MTLQASVVLQKRGKKGFSRGKIAAGCYESSSEGLLSYLHVNVGSCTALSSPLHTTAYPSVCVCVGGEDKEKRAQKHSDGQSWLP